MQRLAKTIELRFPHRVFFTRDVLAPGNRALDDALLGVDRVLPVVEQEVAASWPGLADRLATRLGPRMVAAPLLLPGGETSKNDSTVVDAVTQAIEAHGIDRHNAVLCIGGGGLLDATGFAAATAHRGVRFVRLPTTVLSQGDSGVGVKSGINSFGKKNFIGAFGVPHAVLNDFDFLRTLPKHEARCGLVEAVKVAMVRDPAFFEWIEEHLDALYNLDEKALEEAVTRSATLHFDHICDGGDPFESGSSRPLDFGHWSAHKLEGFVGPALGHGAAVSIGITLDTLYAREAGLLSASETDRVLHVLRGLHLPLYHPALAEKEGTRLVVFAGLEEFREHLGGKLTILLPTSVGSMQEVDAMCESTILRVVEQMRQLA